MIEPMFVRTKSTPNSPRKSVQIVESVRDGDKVKQRIVRYVGIAMDDQELEQLLKLAEHIKEKIEYERTPSLFKPEQLVEMVLEGRAREASDDPINVNLRELQEEQRSVNGLANAADRKRMLIIERTACFIFSLLGTSISN